MLLMLFIVCLVSTVHVYVCYIYVAAVIFIMLIATVVVAIVAAIVVFTIVALLVVYELFQQTVSSFGSYILCPSCLILYVIIWSVCM